MIVQRQTWLMKWGDDVKAVELFRGVRDWDLPYTWRMYRTLTGVGNTFIVETEFEDLATYDKFWAEVASRPEWPAFVEKYRELERVRYSMEFLTLEE
jgi:hypothetical protein